MTETESGNSGLPTLAELRVDGCKIADQISHASRLIELDCQAAATVLNEQLWPYCHSLDVGPAHHFLEVQLMTAKENLRDLTSPWNYQWITDRDELVKTNAISEARRIHAKMTKHLAERIAADTREAQFLHERLVGLAALIHEACRQSALPKK